MALVNYIKKHYWSNGLIMVFILSSITPIITAYNVEVPLFSYNGSLFGATLYIFTACIMILHGYNTLKRNNNRRGSGGGKCALPLTRDISMSCVGLPYLVQWSLIRRYPLLPMYTPCKT